MGRGGGGGLLRQVADKDGLVGVALLPAHHQFPAAPAALRRELRQRRRRLAANLPARRRPPCYRKWGRETLGGMPTRRFASSTCSSCEAERTAASREGNCELLIEEGNIDLILAKPAISEISACVA